ncbi:MAG: KEOPS complex subunit Pcc1 [Candidatus Hermodarchaeota archaeon]
MNSSNYYTIQSEIRFNFIDPNYRDFSFNSFLPDLKKGTSKRSKIIMNKDSNSLIFTIKSSDITAFRASVNDIINFGKIIDGTLALCK